MPPRKHQELLTAAIEREGEAQRRLLADDLDGARAEFAAAADVYRQSWEAAHARAYGRLVGMLKAAVLAGGGAEQAAYVRAALGERDPESPTASYAQALAALILGEDQDARLWAERMSAVGGAGRSGGTDAFVRTGRGGGRDRRPTTARGTRSRWRRSSMISSSVASISPGVAIADTALVLEALAARRGMTAAIESPVLPEPLAPPS